MCEAVYGKMSSYTLLAKNIFIFDILLCQHFNAPEEASDGVTEQRYAECCVR